MGGRLISRYRGPSLGALALVAAVCTVSGCGANHDRRQVLGTINLFARATASKDYRTLCHSVLAPSVVEPLAQVGLPCEQALAKGLGAVRNPQLVIRRVDILGTAALVVVHTSAANQPPSDDTIQLVKVAGAWRVSSLAQPRGRPGDSAPIGVRTASAQPTPLVGP